MAKTAELAHTRTLSFSLSQPLLSWLLTFSLFFIFDLLSLHWPFILPLFHSVSPLLLVHVCYSHPTPSFPAILSSLSLSLSVSLSLSIPLSLSLSLPPSLP